jgi:hypothetical protein
MHVMDASDTKLLHAGPVGRFGVIRSRLAAWNYLVWWHIEEEDPQGIYGLSAWPTVELAVDAIKRYMAWSLVKGWRGILVEARVDEEIGREGYLPPATFTARENRTILDALDLMDAREAAAGRARA